VKHLLLIRHAETDMASRFCGHSDPELNQRGRQQLAGVVDRLSEYAIQRIYTSDLRRARQTAEAIASRFGIGFEVRPGLREIHFGLWEGLSWSEIEERDPVLAKIWAEQYPNSTAPGGESLQQFERRVHAESAFLFAAATAMSHRRGCTRRFYARSADKLLRSPGRRSLEAHQGIRLCRGAGYKFDSQVYGGRVRMTGVRSSRQEAIHGDASNAVMN